MAAMDKAVLFKVVELVLTLLCLGLHSNSGLSNYHAYNFASGTYIGFTVILVGLMIGRQMQYAMDRRLDWYFTAVGLIMFVAAGGLYIDLYDNYINNRTRDIGLSCGAFSIITAIVFLIEGAVQYRK